MVSLTLLNLMFGLGIWFRSGSGSCLPMMLWNPKVSHLQVCGPKHIFFFYHIREQKVSHLSPPPPPLLFFCHHIPDQHLSLHLTLGLTQCVGGRREGSSVRRSSHHLWNFRARPQWKGVLCPPDEECPRFARQRKGFIWPGIWRNLEKCCGDFLGGGWG